ncbi:MAG: alpha/beta hydrolase [Candidatus Eremiobacteraeota bacterium]|nr:alpha/beta hydrolase [Candidatus Eremiobacteraeota bacterium]
MTSFSDKRDGGDRATHYRTADIDGTSIFYREAGAKDAPAVLLLHGFPSSSRMFRNLIPKLSDAYRVIAPDYPGFGHSGIPDRTAFRYSSEHSASIVETLLANLGIDRFAMYVMDFGAPIGYRLAVKYPERVAAIVTQNGPAYAKGPTPFWASFAAYWKDGSAEHREALGAWFLTLDATRHQYIDGVVDPSRIDPENWETDQTLMDRPGVADIMLDLIYDIRNSASEYPAIHQYFRKYRPPTLIATGINDKFFPEDDMRAYLQDLPDAEFHALDTGHFALEDKGDEIAAIMRDFLDRKYV